MLVNVLVLILVDELIGNFDEVMVDVVLVEFLCLVCGEGVVVLVVMYNEWLVVKMDWVVWLYEGWLGVDEDMK